MDAEISYDEVEEAIQNLKPTGPGLSGAHAICFKILWKDNFEAQDRIMEILRHIWNNAEIPEYWNEAFVKNPPEVWRQI